jgi:cytochrome c553
MKRALKIAGIAVAIVVLAAAALFAGAVWLGDRKLQRQVLVKVVPVPYASGPAALKQGRYVFETRGCGSCHGADAAGKVMIDDPTGMYVRTPNLTRGAGSAVADYTEADWVRSIRHGVSPQGRALQIMPSDLYNRLSDDDFAALVAYVRGLPPIAGKPGEMRFPAIVRALHGVGVIHDPAGKIQHGLPPPPPSVPAASAEHGKYVAKMCMGCHGESLSGGRQPDGPPHGPEPANLTPGQGTVMTRYDSHEKFAAMMKSGRRPDGSAIAMPFDALSAFSDTDLGAIYAYLKTLPPKPTGAP